MLQVVGVSVNKSHTNLLNYDFSYIPGIHHVIVKISVQLDFSVSQLI